VVRESGKGSEKWPRWLKENGMGINVDGMDDTKKRPGVA
jgi:hypothetical protein